MDHVLQQICYQDLEIALQQAVSIASHNDSMDIESLLGQDKANELTHLRSLNVSSQHSPVLFTPKISSSSSLQEFWKWHKPQYWSDEQWKVFSSDPGYGRAFREYHGTTVTEYMRSDYNSKGTPKIISQQHFTPVSKHPPADKANNEIAAAIHAAEQVLDDTKKITRGNVCNKQREFTY